MKGILGRYEPYFYAILRITVGLMFMMHGTQKILGWPGGKPPVELASQMGVAGLIELIAGAMIAIGLFTGIAALISALEMVVAYFMAHAPNGPLPILNQGELALMYFFAFLYMAARGSGIWSIDQARNRTYERATVSV
jgi:putative oxidoreductase